MEPKSNEFVESLIQCLLSKEDKSVGDSEDLILLDTSAVCYTEQPMLLSLEEKEKAILCYSHSLLNNVEVEGLPNKDINEGPTLVDSSPPASDVCNTEEQQPIMTWPLEQQDPEWMIISYVSHEPLPLSLPLPMMVVEGFELPVGFRFSPSGIELLLHYLTNKLTGRDLPSNAVKDFDVYTKEPWLLPGADMISNKKCLYFFVPWRKASKDGSRMERTAGKGFWRASTGDKDVRDNQKKLIGYVKQLTYHLYNNNDHNQESNNKSKKTNWIMHEYKLSKSPEMTLCQIKNK